MTMTDPTPPDPKTPAGEALSDARGLTPETVASAIKATEYKYFGDYEMSDGQREAVDVLVDVARQFYTPPATDAAVSGAGFVLVPVEPTEAMTNAFISARASTAQKADPASCNRLWSAMLAAAPKIASDAAGLREVMYAVLRKWDVGDFASRVCSGKGHGSLPADICEAELDAFGEDFIAALAASPIESATRADHAQGGGEVADVVGRAKAMAARVGPHEWGYRDVATGEFIHDEWPFFAADLLATTGGDALEQAAREKVEWLFDQAFADGIAAGKSGDDSILAGSSSAYAQAAIRALSPARDGAGS